MTPAPAAAMPVPMLAVYPCGCGCDCWVAEYDKWSVERDTPLGAVAAVLACEVETAAARKGVGL